MNEAYLFEYQRPSWDGQRADCEHLHDDNERNDNRVQRHGKDGETSSARGSRRPLHKRAPEQIVRHGGSCDESSDYVQSAVTKIWTPWLVEGSER
jgi:hypothetical protein